MMLPEEIWYRILSFLKDDFESLCSLCLTCTQFRRIARPLLYADLEFNISNFKSQQKNFDKFISISNDKVLASYVRRLKINRIGDPYTFLTYGYNPDSCCFGLGQILKTARFPNLTSIYLRHNIGGAITSGARNAPYRACPCIISIFKNHNLQNVEIQKGFSDDLLQQVCFNKISNPKSLKLLTSICPSSTLNILFERHSQLDVPCLESFEYKCKYTFYYNDDPLRDIIFQPIPTLRKFILHSSTLQLDTSIPSLVNLVKSCPQLEEFELSFMMDKPSKLIPQIAPYLSGLKHCIIQVHKACHDVNIAQCLKHLFYYCHNLQTLTLGSPLEEERVIQNSMFKRIISTLPDFNFTAPKSLKTLELLFVLSPNDLQSLAKRAPTLEKFCFSSTTYLEEDNDLPVKLIKSLERLVLLQDNDAAYSIDPHWIDFVREKQNQDPSYSWKNCKNEYLEEDEREILRIPSLFL